MKKVSSRLSSETPRATSNRVDQRLVTPLIWLSSYLIHRMSADRPWYETAPSFTFLTLLVSWTSPERIGELRELCKVYHSVVVVIQLHDHLCQLFSDAVSPSVIISMPSSSVSMAPLPSASYRLNISRACAISSGVIVSSASFRAFTSSPISSTL